MQVQPNSTIYLLAGVPIDKSYNYSLYFSARALQTQYFQGMVMQNGTFTNQQYTRVDRNTLRVAVCADDVINCNYVMFRNNGTLNGNEKYANKWFYAFANVKYLNEYACEVEYEIDDIQTWMFDYEFEECFVEREHSATDVAGDNLQPEPVDTGELVAYSKYEADFTEYMFGAIITTEKIEDSNGEITLLYGGSLAPALNETYKLEPTFYPSATLVGGSNYDTSTGISCGLYVYTGLIINENDWINYFGQQNRYDDYNMADPRQVSGSHYLTFGKLIDAITRGLVNTISSTSESNIVACYQYPAGFNLKSAETLAINDGFKRGIAKYDRSIVLSNPYGNAYTPKNNKMKTAPFAKVYVTTETGSTGEYRFEFFEKNSDNQPIVKWNKISTYFGQPSACLVPVNYKGKAKDYDDAIVTSPYPVPIYSGDSFNTWWQSNKNSFLMGTISNAISLSVGTLLSNTSARMASKALGASSNVIGDIATLTDKSNVPPNAYYQAQNEALNVGTNRTKFIIYFLCVTPEYARKIDSFFTKYGYAVNEVKVPNLQRGLAKRRNWNYLKVKDCMLHGILPADVEKHLEEIYEKGITLWSYDVTVGDYSIANPIVTP